jgi:hypothetical protein
MYPASSYFTTLDTIPPPDALARLAARVFGQVFRRDFQAPGVALISLGPSLSSTKLRQLMVRLKESLDKPYRAATGRRLTYLSLGRFDQQATTKFHLDGSPDEAYLMLGYEPTAVDSRLAVADYTRAAYDLGIEPKRLLADFNPLYAEHERRLSPYVTELREFDPMTWQIVLLNNSSLPYQPRGANMLGVMHRSVVVNPLPGERRIVNSTMIVPAELAADEPLDQSTRRAFVVTRELAGDASRRPAG